jgi:beta-lactamase regulating signal transducer with metallopeptidase domain
MISILWIDSPAWIAMGWTMLHVTWLGAAIGLVAALARRLLRSASAGLRHAVALGFLSVLALSPAAIFLHEFETISPIQSSRLGPHHAGKIDRMGYSGFATDTPTQQSMTVSSGSAPTLTGARHARLDLVVPYLPWFWLSGSSATLTLLGTGVIGVERLRRSSLVLAVGDLPRRCRLLADSLGIVRHVSVAICDRVAAPVLIGILRPLILLPPTALTGWSADQLEMVLLHELAHLRRWDNLINLLQRVVESLLYYHPIVWWLSGWVRLERELCCDRLVVTRTGRPFAYANTLLSLSWSRPTTQQAALAMADRHVVTRIRSLLGLEDRWMKLTLPEGLGVLGAVFAGVTLALLSSAAPPDAAREPTDTVRQALRKAAEDAALLAANPQDPESKPMTLINVAQALLKVGDRDAARASLRLAYEMIGPLASDKPNIALVAQLLSFARQQREVGDSAAARTSLERAVQLIESFPKVMTDLSTNQRLASSNPQPNNAEISAEVRTQFLWLVAEEMTQLGDQDRARVRCRRAVRLIQGRRDASEPGFVAMIAMTLYKSGDAAGARDMIAQAHQAAAGFAEDKLQAGPLPFVVQAMVAIGDLDEAMTLFRTLGKRDRETAIERILESLADDGFHGSWDDPGGIKIVIGAEMMKVKDQALAKRALPKIAQVIHETNDRLFQARSLAMVAMLQADAGDFAGARHTAESMPKIKRAEFPGPTDGFYDAIKPATFGIIAELAFDTQDKAAASDWLRRALALSWEVETANEKIVAQIVIARKQIKCGDRQGARDLLKEAIPFVLTQAEPVRSRSLAMLVECQVMAVDTSGAVETTSAIRDYPGIEKRRALGSVADWYERAGDHARAQIVLQQSLRNAETKPPENARPLPGQVAKIHRFSARSFIDFECELDRGMIEHHNQMASIFLRPRLGDLTGALKMAEELPVGLRTVVVSNLAGQLARNGDVTGALKLAASFKTPEERLTAIQLTACAIRDRRAGE